MQKKILIADDDAAMQAFLHRALTDAGYHVILAEDGKEAMRLAHSEKPHLILLDIFMPAMHGYEVCKKIRSDPDPKIARIKIVIVSAKNYHTDIKTAKQIGIEKYVVKPFAIQELLNIIQDLLKPSS